MLNSLNLNGVWKARAFDGQHGDPGAHVLENVLERGYIEAQVPGELHLDLERQGLIPDCRIGMNAQSARWVEEQMWVYRTHFTAPAINASAKVCLVFDGLDLVAEIYLNGELVGSHANFFTPCRVDVTGKLKEGENLLAVKLDSGLYWAGDKPSKPYNTAIDCLLHKRSWQRKPQCQFSWDWNPRLVNVGIWKGVRLEWTDTARIDAVTVYPELADDHSSAKLIVRPFIENVAQETVDAQIVVTLKETGACVTHNVTLAPGINKNDLCVEVINPKLWWPIPHGEQNLYTVDIKVVVAGNTVDTATRRTGIRSVKICRDKHPVEGNYFIITINGRPIFAKGGNWVPADIIYARVTSERYRELVQLAVDANFNMLRIWGGGLYTDNALLEACDEMGVMVWHDFIFACSQYPVDDNEFFENVKEEITYNVRDLSPHPSLVVWCGNNEIEWGDWDWGYDKLKPHPHYYLFHNTIPRTILAEDPSKPYWPSSPYSEEHRPPNDPTTGDQHPWHVSLGENKTNFWAYRNDVSRFPNEGGFLGASTPASMREFLPESERKLFSPSWELHDNACNYWTKDGLCYESVTDWLNIKPEDVGFEDYLFYSTVVQSEGLQEYINNFRRRMHSTSSAIFWMYNDSWPQSHGWTIIDYYLRKKLCFHPVRRAFAPVHIVPAIDGDVVNIYGINETTEDWTGDVRYGLFKTTGGLPVDIKASAVIPSNQSIILGTVKMEDWEALGANYSGVFAKLSSNGCLVAQNRLLMAKYWDIDWKAPKIKVFRDGNKAVFSSSAFAWAVCIEIDGETEVPDNCFDLIPGVDYSIDWPEDAPLPEVIKYASELFLIQ